MRACVCVCVCVCVCACVCGVCVGTHVCVVCTRAPHTVTNLITKVSDSLGTSRPKKNFSPQNISLNFFNFSSSSLAFALNSSSSGYSEPRRDHII